MAKKHLRSKVDTAPKHESGKSAYKDGRDNPLHTSKSGGVPRAPQYNHAEELESYYESKFLGSKPAKHPNEK